MSTKNNDFMTKQMNLPQTELKPCPKCGEVPKIAYCCGEYFIMSENYDIGTCICESFNEMHASEEQEKQVWNDYIENHRFCESCTHYNKDKPNMCYGETCKDGDMWIGR